jgi:hypothetical protein
VCALTGTVPGTPSVPTGVPRHDAPMSSPIRSNSMTIAQRGRAVATLRVGLFLVLASTGCDAADDQDSRNGSPSEWQTGDAGDVLVWLEEGLLEAGMSLAFDVIAEGAFEAQIVGGVQSTRHGTVALEAEGTFGPEPVTLSLSVQNGRMTGGNAHGRFDEPVPPELHEALAIGLSRMGILHNLARLVGGVPPDRASGGVRDWVEARQVAWVTEKVETGERGITFEIWVDGEPAGEATLWLNGDGQLAGRTQIVRFPGGEMVVRERYSLNLGPGGGSVTPTSTFPRPSHGLPTVFKDSCDASLKPDTGTAM